MIPIDGTDFASRSVLLLALLLLLQVGCHRDMRDQPRYETLEASPFFADGRSARPLVPGTVARGSLFDVNGPHTKSLEKKAPTAKSGNADARDPDRDEVFLTGKDQGRFVTQVPVAVDRALLERGRERFDIFCAPCHARTGMGDGIIVARGFPTPPSYHTDRLRNAPAGHFFDVMSQGFGPMPRFSPQIEPRDRWAIVAYLRVLQLSQNVDVDELSKADQAQLKQVRP